jgi:hypothetical protein
MLRYTARPPNLFYSKAFMADVSVRALRVKTLKV